MALEPKVMAGIIYDSVAIKSAVVSRDETEKGERRKLNFGHTFGHAVEKTLNIPHGEAVSIGMMMAASLSVERNMLAPMEKDRLRQLLRNLRLPTHIEAGCGVSREKVLDALVRDKKRAGEMICFVLLHGIGCAVVEAIAIKELEQVTFL